MVTTAPSRTSGLAIFALVLACLLIIPFAPLVGMILGIVATVRAKANEPKGLAIAAIPVGAIGTLLIQPMCAAIAIPAFIGYTAATKATEARVNLRAIGTSVHATMLEKGAPPPATDWTPSGSACDFPARRYPDDPRAWEAPGWRAISYQGSGKTRFQYRLQPSGASIRVEARADLGCDGTWKRYALEVTESGVGQVIEDKD
jgi:hypothetical protein